MLFGSGSSVFSSAIKKVGRQKHETTVLPRILFVYESWSFRSRGKLQTVSVFENGMLSGIFAAAGWRRRLLVGQLHDLCSFRDIMRMIRRGRRGGLFVWDERKGSEMLTEFRKENLKQRGHLGVLRFRSIVWKGTLEKQDGRCWLDSSGPGKRQWRHLKNIVLNLRGP